MFAIANGVLGALTSPAMRGIVPELVDPANIKQANSLLSASRSAAKIVGPSVAGVLVATVGGGWGIALDAASFFIASACMSPVRIPAAPIAPRTSLVAEMREGWSYFRQRKWIWSITVTFTVLNLIQMGVWQVLGPIIAAKTFGSAGWGLALGMKSVGLLLASLVVLRLPIRRPLCASVLGMAPNGIPMIALGQSSLLLYLLGSSFVAGLGQTFAGIGWDTSLQKAVPRDKLSRVMAIDEFGSYIAIPVGEMLATPLAGAFGYSAIATIGGIAFIVVSLLPLAQRQVRSTTMEQIDVLG